MQQCVVALEKDILQWNWWGSQKSQISAVKTNVSLLGLIAYLYRGADKSLARPGRKQVTAAKV